ncbi:hypothetical protein BT63DRAFT_119168 [Microthyrium microscopicum]|uniref:Uncharacterized protein n=1 Tax=Microthyrium microscopicum TaxID=703497 RepID=A0A6A6TUL9_9PEZI|nr:hypothetical protein BT63DRAFT_119168 [Microthyrium microscopicum]
MVSLPCVTCLFYQWSCTKRFLLRFPLSNCQYWNAEAFLLLHAFPVTLLGCVHTLQTILSSHAPFPLCALQMFACKQCSRPNSPMSAQPLVL